ncbi:MAG: DUF5615 family PIN-like protein [Anaerolineae bacterium]|nr:DUF5615 family PIN-like protein [Anaerolineae bacterium]
MKFLADENFNNDILRGVWRRIPDASFTRVQDTDIAGADDPRVLEYAVEQGYIVLSHDVNTMRGYFYDRITAELPVPGLFLVHKQTPIGEVIDALELIILASDESEWIGQATYIP